MLGQVRGSRVVTGERHVSWLEGGQQRCSICKSAKPAKPVSRLAASATLTEAVSAVGLICIAMTPHTSC